MSTLHHGIIAYALLIWSAMLPGIANAQSISINPKTLEPDIAEKILTPHSFYMAGLQTFGLEGIENKFYPMGSVGKYLLSLATLRLVSEKTVSLDVPLHTYIPNIIEKTPFKRAITLRHLLTETAGFAVPAHINPELPLINYSETVRTAGYVPHHDIVGWGILAALLEHVTGHPLKKVILDTVLTPLGANALDLHIPEVFPLLLLPELKAKPALFAAILRVTVWNQTTTGERFLPPSLHKELTELPSWRFHPMGPARTVGLDVSATSKHPSLHLYSGTTTEGPFLRAYPKIGMAFITLTAPPPSYKAALDKLAEQYFPPHASATVRKGGLIQYGLINGLYVRSDAPSLSLHKRLTTLQNGTLHIEEHPTGILTVSKGHARQSYHKKQPFYFESVTGKAATFSAYKQGGYLMLEGTLYHYVGLLGDKSLMIDMLPLVVIMLLSTALYLRKKYGKSWHNMARITLIGTLCAASGMAAEYYLWETATYSWNVGWLIALWRLLLNIGLALILSHPLFTLSFARGGKMPTSGLGTFLVPLHMGLITIAAAWLFLMMIAWGIVGTL